MDRSDDFDSCFQYLTEHSPFPWQRELFRKFLQNQIPRACDIPTGLGKTSIIVIWLLALAHHARARTRVAFPRRLVYVVNRRIVVDQATREAEQMRKALSTKVEVQALAKALRSLGVGFSDSPLGISTLRGQFADNAEWREDPSQPSVIVGTVDMIGSRLLFAGYGRGFKSRPLHAGFLGQDTLLVHDEAHLEPAFQSLIDAIEAEQKRCGEYLRFHVMALTATSRSDGVKFGLTDADRAHATVRKRIEAKKWIAFVSVDDQRKTADEVVKQALKHKESAKAIIIFLRKLEDVEKVRNQLDKRELAVQVLTGTLRGLERDAMAKEDDIFARFLRKPGVPPRTGTVYLVCTSAGEVGVDISADHMICDLNPFDSMCQRFGRVNRFGDGDACLEVVHPSYDQKNQATESSPSVTDDDQPDADPNSLSNVHRDGESKKKAESQSPFEQACERSLLLLQTLPKRDDYRHNASPAALADLPAADRQAAFTPQPAILAATEILFDAWALTSVRGDLPGRPPVADWLHGIAKWDPRETHVAWRAEVEWLTGELLERYEPEDLLEDYPLKPHELLRGQTSQVWEHLETIANRCPDLPTWLIESDGKVRALSLTKLVEKDKRKKPVVSLADCTVLLPPLAGGLKDGMLTGAAGFEHARRERYDVADQWKDENEAPCRRRIWDDAEPPEGMRVVQTIDTRPNGDDEREDDEQNSSRRYWRWYVRPRSADDDGSRTARQAQELTPHLQLAKHFASAFVAKLELSDIEASAVMLAAKWHDLGKNRKVWQRSIGNRDPNLVLAKSGVKMRPIDLNDYRHEFGSLMEVSSLLDFKVLKPDVMDLVLHLIAAHHGRARPHFPEDEAFDPERSEEDAAGIAREVPRRFARLQRKYGRWGLAYLESLVRAADVLASQANEAGETEPADRTAASTQEAAR